MTLNMEPPVVPTAVPPAKRPSSDLAGPSAPTPARVATPPPPSDRGRLETRQNMEVSAQRQTRQSGRTSDTTKAGGAFDVDAVDSALLREVHRQQRESTPGSSPHRKRQRINGDRWVFLLLPPSRGVKASSSHWVIGSYRRDPGKIFRPVSVSFTKTALPPPHRDRRSELHMASFIFKRVCWLQQTGHL